ncbi:MULTISPECIES: APC family permease [Rhodococcus]|uniref:APC family permease n=1 Tax=Rhodococcus TaxID=1827 RepID=UPI0035592819
MTDVSEADGAAAAGENKSGQPVQRLKKNSVGLAGVVFMAVATAAPITAMVGNIPIAIGFGNGSGAPAGYLVATIVLGLFGVGYAAMARHITATGAFYGFISHGLGRVLGMASGTIITMAYVVFEASLVGIFSFFSHSTVEKYTGISVPWIVFALVMLAANAILSYFDINLAAKVLGAFLVTEILMLGLMAVAVLVHGGGPDGFAVSSINPVNAFEPAAGVGGAVAGIGLFFAFWSWVGFESTAMYGEESRDPKRIIPRAILLSVLGIGLFYVFVSWMAIAGTGPARAIELAQDSSTSSEIFFGPTRDFVGGWAVSVFEVLLISGSFACGMAFHQCASRYIYALGREGLIPGSEGSVGRTHPVHGSPHIASFVQTVMATAIVIAFAVAGMDPYIHLFGLLAILGTMAILIVQSLCAFAVIGYFHVSRNHPETANWFRTLLAPLLGGLGMLYVVYLLWENRSFAAGAAADTLLFRLSPYIVGGLFLFGMLVAVWYRYRAPERYARIGRIVLDDTPESEPEAEPSIK